MRLVYLCTYYLLTEQMYVPLGNILVQGTAQDDLGGSGVRNVTVQVDSGLLNQLPLTEERGPAQKAHQL